MISSWLRTTIVLALLGVWAAYVVVQLIRDRELDPLVWGVPGGFFLLLGPGLKGGNGHGRDHDRRDDDDDDRDAHAR